MTGKLPANPADKDFESLVFDFKYDKEQFKDPAALGLMLYRLAREREQTNLLFKEILKRLDELSEKLSAGAPAAREAPVVERGLSETDAEILRFVRQAGAVDAEQVRRRFGYKGKNAASARLNNLYNRGLLKKTRAGKKVLYHA